MQVKIMINIYIQKTHNIYNKYSLYQFCED